MAAFLFVVADRVGYQCASDDVAQLFFLCPIERFNYGSFADAF
jgi:hypothetical protein